MRRWQPDLATFPERARAPAAGRVVALDPPSLQARGSALVSVMLVVFLFSVIALGAAIVVRLEIAVAERFRQSADAFYAAQAALDVAISELRPMAEWTSVVGGGVQSPLSDGAFSGAKAVPGGGTVTVCCGAGSAFDRLVTESQGSPHPYRRVLAWRPYLWTTFHALVPRDPASRLYVIVFVAEDEEDVRQASTGDKNGIVLVRADAIAPGGLHRRVEALLARRVWTQPEPGGSEEAPAAVPPGVAVLGWREVR